MGAGGWNWSPTNANHFIELVLVCPCGGAIMVHEKRQGSTQELVRAGSW